MNSPPPCSSCKAECCQFVPMRVDEYKRLQKARPREVSKLKIERIERNMILIVGRCPWVEKNHTCAAYEARPWICRLIGAPNYPCHKQPGGEEKINAMYRKYRPSKAL